LGKTDAVVESIVRKIEKSSNELSTTRDLTVGGVPSSRYIQQFAWDYAKYPNRRPLKELVAMIGGGVTAIDEELKQLSQSYADKQMSLQESQRKKKGNLMQADLNDVLTAEDMTKVKVLDSEYMKTVFIAVPTSMQEDFVRNIDSLGADIAGFGGPDWSKDARSLGQPVKFGTQVDRFKLKGSPVVPGSAVAVKSDSDSALFAVTILKSQYQAGYYEGDEFVHGTTKDFEAAFALACREKRYTLREFEYDPNQAQRSAMAMEQQGVEVESMKSGLSRWCKTHYGEAFVAWMHIKVIRVFVESVLRYGLPVDFTAVLYKTPFGKEKVLTNALDAALSEKKDAAADDQEDDAEEYHDFVLIKFEP
jgi:V-type H+-transporting ATPase subunit C